MAENLEIEGFKPGPGKVGRPPKNRVQEEIRPPVSDSQAEADEYAQQMLDEYGDSLELTDEFYVDPASIPDGWTYQWKRLTVAGKEDPHYIVGIRRAGWRAVPTSRHPEQMPTGTMPDTPIEKKGLALMELPSTMVARFRKRDQHEAYSALENADRQLYETPANTASRDKFPQGQRQLEKEWMAPPPAPKRTGPDGR
jgi:hypothetical protein